MVLQDNSTGSRQRQRDELRLEAGRLHGGGTVNGLKKEEPVAEPSARHGGGLLSQARSPKSLCCLCVGAMLTT